MILKLAQRSSIYRKEKFNRRWTPTNADKNLLWTEIVRRAFDFLFSVLKRRGFAIAKS